MAYQSQDPQIKEAYKKDCSIDYSECCKSKTNRRISKTETKKKEIKKETDVKSSAEAKSIADAKSAANNIISKIPSTIQVMSVLFFPYKKIYIYLYKYIIYKYIYKYIILYKNINILYIYLSRTSH